MLDMKVTSVELNFPARIGPKFKCWAKIRINNKLLITGIKLFEDKARDDVDRYIRFPDRQPSLHATGGEYVNIAIVNTNDEEFRKHITDAVFEEYDRHPRNPANRKQKEIEE